MMSSHCNTRIRWYIFVFSIRSSVGDFDGHSVYGLLSFLQCTFWICDLFYCLERCVQYSAFSDSWLLLRRADDRLFLITPNYTVRLQCLLYNFGYFQSRFETHSSCIQSTGRCSSPADKVICTLAPVISKFSSSEIVGQRVADAFGTSA